MRFSDHFGLNREQPELDFVDIDPAADIPLWIDPYALSRRDDAVSVEWTGSIISFFQAAVDGIRGGHDRVAQELLNNLSEPNETCLGFSKGRPSGRGVSGKQSLDLYKALAESRAVRTGLLTELADSELFVEGIGDDKLSDITTNIIRHHLIRYTQEQCALHGINLEGTVASGRLWNADREEWHREYVRLPVINSRSILLVPKAIVRWRMAMDPHEYYDKFVLHYIEDGELNRGSRLVRVLKNGTRRVAKKDLKREYPYSKEFLSRFTREHPEVLEGYKRQKGQQVHPIANSDLPDVDEVVLAKAMIQRLGEIGPGNRDATKFHRLMVGVLEFILYPNAIAPVLEREIHEGRKRIDIWYTNAAEDGRVGR